MDEPPKLNKEAERAPHHAMELVPGEDAPFDYAVWGQIAGATDQLVSSAGSLSVAAHAYTARWRKTRQPTTLTPAGVEAFKDRVEHDVYAYAADLAKLGVRPLADRPPTRERQQAYSTAQDNPERTASDLWEDLVKGRLMVYTTASEPWAEQLMESRLVDLSQKDVVNPDQMKVRYISDPRLEINPRIDTDRHPRCIVPKHQHVARRVLYWQRRYPGIDVLLCKRDVEGAFKLIPVAVEGAPHIGCRFATYVVTYLSMFIGWKPSPANWGVVTTLLLQFVASYTPVWTDLRGPEALTPFQYVDDSAFVEPWIGIRPWLAVSIW